MDPKANQNNIQISLIIPIHQLGESLEKCLTAIGIISKKKIIEIILVLDGLKQDKHFFAKFDLPSLLFIEIPTSRGPAFARNQGALKASGKFLFFVDSDVSIPPDTCDLLYEKLTAANAPDAIIGSYDDKPEEETLVSKYRNLLHHYTHQQASQNASTFWGACGIIRKDIFLSVGGFDTGYEKPSVEDIELGYRLRQNGYQILLDKNIQVKHLKTWSFAKMIQTDIFLRAIPWTKLIHQYRKLETKDLNVNSEERLAVLLVSFIILTLLAALFISSIFFSFAILLAIALIVLKRKTYVFFSNYFQFYQLPLIVLLHWGYLLSAGVGFIMGSAHFIISDLFRRKKKKVIKTICHWTI
jgi:GT2 family glycosyltransferase